MADAQKEEARWKREERRDAMFRQKEEEEYWFPNRDKDQEHGGNAGYYFTSRMWDDDELSKCLDS
jgi:hypothetical protein